MLEGTPSIATVTPEQVPTICLRKDVVVRHTPSGGDPKQTMEHGCRDDGVFAFRGRVGEFDVTGQDAIEIFEERRDDVDTLSQWVPVGDSDRFGEEVSEDE